MYFATDIIYILYQISEAKNLFEIIFNSSVCSNVLISFENNIIWINLGVFYSNLRVIFKIGKKFWPVLILANHPNYFFSNFGKYSIFFS